MARKHLPKGPVCQVCQHRDRALIEATRMAGASLDNIASKYGVHRDSLWRHMRRHVSDEQKAAYISDVPLRELAAKAAEESLSLLDYLALIRATLMQQFQLAAVVDDRNGTALMASRLLETLRQIGNLTGEMARLAPGMTINNTAVFINSPQFAELHSMLIRKLRGYPEALAAVLGGQRELEAGEARGGRPNAPMLTVSPPEAAHA
jgi:hypothetical protein